MRTALLLSVILIAGAWTGRGQTCEILIAQGRAALATNNMGVANAHFRDALTLCPSHQTGNVLYAATRLLSLPNEPVTSNFLTRLGLPLAGRDIYDWAAEPPTDTNGVLVAPGGVNAAEVSLHARTNLIAALLAAQANLAQVSDTNFLLTLAEAETKASGVTLDYGDVQMLRAMLRALEYFTYTICAWNADAEFSSLRKLHDAGLFSIEGVLADSPELLTFRTTNDLIAAKIAFENFVDLYLLASQHIRGRPLNVDRLFNLDLEKADDEEVFRCGLMDVRASLIQPVVLCSEGNFTVHFSRHFSGANSMRSLLPDFAGNRVIGGTLPDPTFGGVLLGLATNEADRILYEKLGAVTRMTGSNYVDESFTCQFHTASGRIYAVEYSTDLVDWYELTEFYSEGGTYTFVDDTLDGADLRFYRLVEKSSYIVVEGRVVNGCSGQPVAGASVVLGIVSTVTDAQGRFSLRSQPIYPPWDAYVEVSAPGHLTRLYYFWGEDSEDDVTVFLQPATSSAPPVNDSFGNPTSLTGLPVSGSGSNCGATRETEEPLDIFPGIEATVWFRWTAPFSGQVRIRAESEAFFPIVHVYTNAPLQDVQFISGDYQGLTFEAVAGAIYYIAVGSPDFNPEEQGPFNVTLTMPPQLVVHSPEDGGELIGTSNVVFNVTANDPDGAVREVRFYLNGDWIYRMTNAPYQFTWPNVRPNYYEFEVRAYDEDGNITQTFGNFVVRPANDAFANRTMISGTNISVRGTSGGASRELDEPDYGGVHSVWWSWTATEDGPVTVSAVWDEDIYGPNLLAVYTGASVDNLTEVARNDFSFFGNQVTFEAEAGTEYQIAVDEYYNEPEGFTLKLVTSAPPTVELTSPTEGFYETPTDITLSATADDGDGTVVRVEFYVNDRLLYTRVQAPFNAIWPDVPPGYYYIQARAIDDRGLTTFTGYLYIEVYDPAPPPGPVSARPKR